MSTFDYTALEAKAAALLDKFGAASKLTRWTKGAYDAAAGQFGAGSSTDHDVTAVAVDYDKDEIDGTLVQRDDVRGIMKGSDLMPVQNDKITIPAGGTKYEIISVKEISPDRTTVVVYMLHLRK